MNLKSEIQDIIFERLRALEGKTPTPEQKAIDDIFKKLRFLEKRTEVLEQLKLKIFGGAIVLGFLLEIYFRIR